MEIFYLLIVLIIIGVIGVLSYRKPDKQYYPLKADDDELYDVNGFPRKLINNKLNDDSAQ